MSDDRDDSLACFDGRVRRVPCDVRADTRGMLLPFDLVRLPFVPRRVFTVSCVPAGTDRGAHAHKTGTQFLVCLQGRVRASVRIDARSADVILEPGREGLLVGPGVWSRQTYLDPGSVLLVFASEPYDPDSYLEDPESAA